MDKTTLILMMVSLLVVFIVLVTAYVIMGRSKKAVHSNAETAVTFETMKRVINRVTASNEELNRAVDTIIECYCQISDGQRGIGAYESLLENLCIHPNTDSKMILRFQKALIATNQRFKEQIEKALKLGLAARGK
ncbi:MAG: hypothetical protein Q8K81_09465 [Sulfuricurvum sp.]|nr:hypothetical protein [Sulfuricurvum sp.]